uniref:Uncharacterized protein n=1 Tax=Setaria italica TaxID=4555 RepID=K4A497_SETIT
MTLSDWLHRPYSYQPYNHNDYNIYTWMLGTVISTPK